jgi:GH24 family phage-related lysozyme (muramidase)
VKLSDKGKRVLAQVEACVLTPYQDGKHHSIGFGHNGPEVAAMGPISVEKAFEMLEEDLKPREARINELIKKPITQEQFDALVLLHYQSGNRYLPLAAHMINYGEMGALKRAWNTWSYSAQGKKMSGLETRRQREKDIFFKGDYGPIDSPIKLWKGNPRTTPYAPYKIKDSDLGGS